MTLYLQKSKFFRRLNMSEATKVFKTSIVPAGESLEPVRTAKLTANSLTIEVFHVACFLVVFSFIFAGLWKRAVRAEKEERVSSTSQVNA
jgi:hypothetical protein